MIVRNVGRFIEPALRSVLPYTHEVVIVDTGSDDDTKDVIRRVAPGARIFDFTAQTHPQAFLLDVAETWDNLIPGPFTGRHILADFGGARQFGWEKATGDYLMWIDSDDVVERGEKIHEIINEMAATGTDYALLNYDYSNDGRGNVNLQLSRERIVRRTFGSLWMQPVHEVLVPIGVGRRYGRELVNIVHKRGELGATHDIHHRNLKILYHWLKQNKDEKTRDPRMLFYLGLEERFIWPDKALAHFSEYCRRSGWDEERGIAHVFCGQLHERAGRLDEAFAEYAQAMVEFPWSPDGLFGCARIAYTKNDWQKTIEYTERAFKVKAEKDPERVISIMWNPLDHDYRPLIYYSAALVNSGQWQKAIEVCNAGLKLVPDDPFLKGNKEASQNNLRIMAEQQAKSAQAATVPKGKIPINLRKDAPLDAPPIEMATDVLVTWAIQALWRRVVDEQPAKALSLLDNLPASLLTHPKIRGARDFTLGRLGAPALSAAASSTPSPANPPAPAVVRPVVTAAPAKLDIVCWTGPGWEVWSPKSINVGGIGGSETAAVLLMRELAKRGHRVRVIAQPGPAADVYEGVEYINFDDAVKIPACTKPDVLVVSRAPEAFMINGFDARSNFLWVHDVHVGTPVGRNMEGIQRADKIFCLSNWHKGFFLEQYPFLHPDTVHVTRNGIDVSRFAREPQKQGNRLIWASTPHRGVDRLIDLLPHIRAQVPDAEVHVYYGFMVWERIARARDSQEELAQITRFKTLLTTTPGVVFHDRVGQQELADAYSVSKVWAYPTWFQETSCISAMEAQAAGCVPVTTALAALNETVKHGVLLAHPSTSADYGKNFVDTVVHLLKDESARRTYADAGRKWALANLGWDAVAAEWEGIFRETIAAKAANPIGKFGNL